MSVTCNVSHDIVMSVTLLHESMEDILNSGWTDNLSITYNATS